MVDVDTTPTDDGLQQLYRTMLRIRRFEEEVSVLYRDGHVPGFSHLSIGQEPVPAAVCSLLRPTDVITSTHRGHGHVLAKGADMRRMFAELMGRATGCCRGMGGSMHIADVSVGVFGANGIVAAGIPIALGAAVAAKGQTRGDVAVALFGDGAVFTGSLHEGVNLAALWELPVLFVCENNHWAEFTPTHDQHPVPPYRRAGAYGIPSVRVDGEDVSEVAARTGELLKGVRSGRGPALLEVEVERWHGHYEGDPLAYRAEGAREAYEARDPVARARGRIDTAAARLDAAVEAEVVDARDRAQADPVSDADWGDLTHAPRPGKAHDDVDQARSTRNMDAINQALADALEADPTVFLAGIDIGRGEGIFRVTRGLLERFGPDRVVDTPIAETALMGLGVGAAMAGRRPVLELMFIDFLGVCLDQLMNQAAKMRLMTGGQVSVPLVVRTQFGAGRSSGAQHSQSLEGLLASIPGLTVVMPTTPADAYGLLRTAIEDPNPVVFIEHRHMYGDRGPAPGSHHRVPLGRASVRRRGNDVTIVASGRMVDHSLAAAARLDGEGVDAEVLDLRTIVPLDLDTVFDSVDRTRRLVVAHEAATLYGPGAEVVAATCQTLGHRLVASPRRVGAPATPAPYAREAEQAWLPGREEIEEAVRATVHPSLREARAHCPSTSS